MELRNPKPVADPNAPADGELKKPDPADFEFGILDERYTEAVAEFKAEQRIQKWEKEQAEKAEQKAQETAAAQFAEKIRVFKEKGAEKIPDFKTKVVDAAARGDWKLSPTMGELLVESEVGADIALHLATHPEESIRVFGQTPLEQARYFGRMEAQFSAKQGAAPGDDAGNPAPITPRVPPPVPAARGAGGKFQASADSEDFNAFEEVANRRK